MKNKLIWMLVGAFLYALSLNLYQLSNYQIKEKFKTMNTILNMEALQNELDLYKNACGVFPQNLDELKTPVLCKNFKSSNLSENRYSDYMNVRFSYVASNSSYEIKSSPLSWIEGSSSKRAFKRSLDPE